MASATLLSLKSLCGGGVPSSHPSLGLSVFFLSFPIREVEYLETKEIEACGTPAYKDPAARALKAGVLIVWDPDHLQAKRDGKGEVAMEEVVRGRVRESGDGGRGTRTGVDADRSLHASEGTG